MTLLLMLPGFTIADPVCKIYICHNSKKRKKKKKGNEKKIVSCLLLMYDTSPLLSPPSDCAGDHQVQQQQGGHRRCGTGPGTRLPLVAPERQPAGRQGTTQGGSGQGEMGVETNDKPKSGFTLHQCCKLSWLADTSYRLVV